MNEHFFLGKGKREKKKKSIWTKLNKMIKMRDIGSSIHIIKMGDFISIGSNNIGRNRRARDIHRHFN